MKKCSLWLLLLVALILQNCHPVYIKGTKVLNTPKNREIMAVLNNYKLLILQGRWDKLLELVSPNFYETRGTPEKDDDYGYRELKENLLKLKRDGIRVISLSIKVEKINYPKPNLAEVFVVKRYTMIYPRGKNRPAFDTGSIYQKMVLEKRGKRWLFLRW